MEVKTKFKKAPPLKLIGEITLAKFDQRIQGIKQIIEYMQSRQGNVQQCPIHFITKHYLSKYQYFEKK